ncbi:MAG: type IX secretion system sortase PorU [Bacteroidales bacterium]|nr:type IX secretion system sortase PorU [Bacteroidales bacterium]MCF8404247.1 type IX secretion system sortase PorU [Bacteroidales bacterium]
MMIEIKKVIVFVLLFSVVFLSRGQTYQRIIHWKGIQSFPSWLDEEIKMLQFEGSVNEPGNGYAPFYFEVIPLPEGHSTFDVLLENMIFSPLTSDEKSLLENSSYISSDIKTFSYLDYDRKKPQACISFLPVRINEITGQAEKLTHFNLKIETSGSTKSSLGINQKTYKPHSVLASGNWHKMAVNNTGIYKLSYQYLSDIGINVSSLNPQHIRIYGNGGGMVPENIEKFRYDDLYENAIFVDGENDGSFDPGDFVLFYGEAPNVMEYSYEDNLLHQNSHYYSDYNYYFITTDLGPGKRIPFQNSGSLEPNYFVNEFHDAIHYEIEETNLLGSGRIWYGETFDLFNNLEKEYTITNLVLNKYLTFGAEAAAHSDQSSYFSFFVNDVKKLHLPIQSINSNNPNGNYAYSKYDTVRFKPTSENLTIRVEYSKPISSSVGYLDYFTLNFKRTLAFTGGQMDFRDFKTAQEELVAKYSISKSNGQLRVWNVSSSENPIEIIGNLNNTIFEFTYASDSLAEFVAFDGTSYLTPSSATAIENQDLHATEPYEMIILTYPAFRSQAERLAQFHRDNDNLSVFVIEPQPIYNEFSGGSQDISGIRDFMKMLYDKAPEGEEPKYMLLFGDGSFDFKDRVENNTNFIPSWQSYNSLNPVSSYVKDDYFGLLDNATDTQVDLGIGRFVVSNTDQAKKAVDKVIHYATNTPVVMGDWRNIICLLGDDEDSNLHFHDAEELAEMIDTINANINIDKIYLDAYPQLSTPSGERYPDVTLDLTNRVERGALIVNYVGHGGEGGLAHERILKVSDIQGWKNYDNMPVFITATCEFSRFDDPERTSAGEYIFLNENGGGISLFTTTRATYAGANAVLNKNFYRYALKIVNGEYPRMGDIIRQAKNNTGSIENTAKFMLLGDPALKIAIPKNNVATLAITNVQAAKSTDTIQALSEIKISGEIHDLNGNKLVNYNGTLYPIVFDKPAKYTTLGNDPASIAASFYIQKNILYKGKASISNGEWEFTFIAPKDIAYNYGFGKLSYYAHNETSDAAGHYMDITIGGYNENALADNMGPQIDLYMNDVFFEMGGLTDENPHLLALIEDESGINTVGSGIGHDILAVLDGKETYVINDYYEAELDNFRKGEITYPLYNLSDGLHKLSLRVWDIHNNSTTAFTEFIVAGSNDMAIQTLMNYPNPFKEHTTFSFEHNQVEQPLDISIQIFGLDGRLIRTISDIYYAGGYKYKSGTWDATNEYGSRIEDGLYVYKVLVKNFDGTVAEETSKLVLLK